MTSQDQTATHPVWQRDVTDARPTRHRKPFSGRQALFARLEELRFRSGVTMLVTVTGVLALVGGGLGLLLHEGTGGSAPGPRTAGATTGSSPSPSPARSSASADPTHGVRVPPVTPERSGPPPRPAGSPPPRPKPRATDGSARPEPRDRWRPPYRRDHDRPGRQWRDRPWWRHR